MEPALPAQPVEVRGNTYRFEQVLLNLLANSRDAFDGRPEGARGGRIRIGVEPGETRVRVRVEDDGPGIPRELLGRVFDPFFTTKGPDKGTGLGLSVSYGIVKELGGELRVESKPGSSTCFTISLPTPGEGSMARKPS